MRNDCGRGAVAPTRVEELQGPHAPPRFEQAIRELGSGLVQGSRRIVRPPRRLGRRQRLGAFGRQVRHEVADER